MRPWSHSNLWLGLALALAPVVVFGQPVVSFEAGRWFAEFHGQAPAGQRVRVNAAGAVALEAGVSAQLVYTVRVGVRAPNEAAARSVLAQYGVQVEPKGDWTVLTAPGGPMAVTVVRVRGPKLLAASVTTPEGPVEVTGVDGAVEVDAGVGGITVDRIAGKCRLSTRGGELRVGEVGGGLSAITGGGPISVRQVRGAATLRTVGGDIWVGEAQAGVSAETGAGSVTVERSGGAVSAATGGGRITVGTALGIVNARNMAGPVQVGQAAGVISDSAVGGVSLANVSGGVRVTTMMGSIRASMSGGQRTGESFLGSANGDITVLLPSNWSVTIEAENERADSPRRIISEFPQVKIRNKGTRVVAEGFVNGGGPVLRISAGAGTIYIKRQP